MPEELYIGKPKPALVYRENKAHINNGLEYQPEVLDMLALYITVDQQVIDVYEGSLPL